MAVDNSDKKDTAKGSSGPVLRFEGRQFIVGANVFVAVVLAGALLVFANYLAFNFNQKSDWTSTGINSLSEQTRKLMDRLDKKVTLTSLYSTLQVPEAEAEAKKFRTAVEDMLELYQAEAPGQVEVEFINPAKDRDKILALIEDLRSKPAYQDEAKKHQELIQDFNGKLAPQILALLQEDLAVLQETLDENSDLQKVREYTIIMRNCQVLSQQLNQVKQSVASLTGDELPKYTAAVDAIKGVYEQIKSALSEGGKWMAKVDAWTKQNKVDPPKNVDFFKNAPQRYEPIIEEIQAQLDKAKDLPTLKLEELDRQIQPDTVIVETEEEARVIGFDEMWPPLRRGQFGQAQGSRFEDRRNAGEAEISSAVLQLTQKKQAAVVFVRHGGQPLFFGGMMMGGGQAPYGAAKERLEKANFLVKEWDVATKKEPPEFEEDKQPDRTIWVLLKPEAAQPPQNMPPQMRQRPKMFGPQEQAAVERAMGSDPRVMLVAGWVPPPRNPMMMASPPNYEYNDWLKTQWGVEVQFSYPVLQGMSFEPGKLRFNRNPFQITEYSLTDHPITEPLKGLQGALPEAAPLKRTDKPVDGVELTDLILVPERDTIWAESDINKLGQQYQKNTFVVIDKSDLTGPFALGLAGVKTREGETASKMVLISSRSFATDQVANSRALVQMGNRMMLALANPANMDLFVNAIQWLNDNEGQIGKGIETRDIPRLHELEKDSTGYTVSWIVAVIVWPLLALAAGVGVWFVRRR